ncbi:hypothetical protein ANRL2_04225 [Anaerolineae bacterium]|nr:hypothetical protein ANRL2_04225 [Anaerolineae bacterium]
MNESDRIVLTVDFPQYQLQAGDMGVIVLVHDGGAGYEVEIFTAEGKTYAVITVEAAQIRPVQAFEIAPARPIKA